MRYRWRHSCARQCGRFLTDGLKRLEYRGYDSSGIAVQTDEGTQTRAPSGRVALMEAAAKRAWRVWSHGHRSHSLGDPRRCHWFQTPIRISRVI